MDKYDHHTDALVWVEDADLQTLREIVSLLLDHMNLVAVHAAPPGYDLKLQLRTTLDN